MSDLKELTYDIITNAFIKALADIDKGTAERDKHFVAATELIIKNFKDHIINESERLGSTMPNDSWGLYLKIGLKMYCKTIEESLE